MQLSPHFADTELGVASLSIDAQIYANAKQICAVLLEPIRAQFGPIAVDDGYRNPAHNAAVGGAQDSQHLYIGENSAADIRPLNPVYSLGSVFDWIRLNSHLPFDQCILEVAPGTKIPSCIHISYNGALPKQRRQALTGETNGAGAYQSVEVNP
jgi:hypothetical protein